jgi:AAA15 family ATPase/GTPase
MDKSQCIKIQNFRCFKELEVNGFKRVNLIGGKNNAGKTSLLEALLLYFYPIPPSIMELKKSRKESSNSIRKNPKDAWNSFFYNENIENDVFIEGYFENIGDQVINISVSYFFQNSILIQPSIIEDEDLENNEDFENNLGSLSATLKIKQILNEEKPIRYNLTADNKGLSLTKRKYLNDYKSSIPFLPSSTMSSPNYGIKIAKQYDKIDYDGKGSEVLKILKILDPSIEGLRTYSFVEPTLYIQTKTQHKGLPISLFGDAVYRVTAIILEILDKKHKVLFIDEIENGIHYTSQKSFWEGLFRLAEELDTLIFATTHSLEMIKAFAEAGKKFPDQGAYFELAYSPRTNKIVAINRDLELLEYDLEHGKAIRGE